MKWRSSISVEVYRKLLYIKIIMIHSNLFMHIVIMHIETNSHSNMELYRTKYNSQMDSNLIAAGRDTPVYTLTIESFMLINLFIFVSAFSTHKHMHTFFSLFSSKFYLFWSTSLSPIPFSQWSIWFSFHLFYFICFIGAWCVYTYMTRISHSIL